MPTFRSGAFAQQCYSSHPGSLTFKAFTVVPPPGVSETAPLPAVPAGPPNSPAYRVVVTCDTCNMRHRFTIEKLTSRLRQEEENEIEAMIQLPRCAAEHPTDLRVSAMDVTNDVVKLRCGGCHRLYNIALRAVETYQR